tara:strand:- start:6434 stop:7705 length:1272 start_codon:yes stop_codon:yes gene_type:complete
LLSPPEIALKKLFAVFFFLVNQVAFAQVITGQVVDSVTLEPLPYVNIGISQSTIGTLTNLDGRFSIDASTAKDKDSLRFSLLSYKHRSIAIASIKDSIRVKVSPSAYTLEEVVVSPQPPEEYIKEAIRRIPDNYINTPYNTRVYFREVVKLNGKYLNYTEAIMNAYNLPITGAQDDSSRLQLIAMRHINEEDEAVKTIPIKRRKKKQDEIDSTIISLAAQASSQNGPYLLLDSGLVRRWYKYDSTRVFGGFHFRFKNVIPYDDRKLLNISYGDKRKEERDREHGSLYLEENNLAFESYTYQYSTIPAKVKAALFLFGYGMDDLRFRVKATTQPTADGYIGDITILRADVSMEKIKWFKDNIPIVFETEAVMIVLDHQVSVINPCTEGIIIQRGKAIYEQGESNPDHPIWEQYKGVILPEGSTF